MLTVSLRAANTLLERFKSKGYDLANNFNRYLDILECNLRFLKKNLHGLKTPKHILQKMYQKLFFGFH